ncbi:MAG TPA: class I SAM-dependent methyltransferase [Flavisolibacter sp.]|jgi:SAM-dependent methyltransferase|nr:class I SAM-dependent methyltransferase [Flavisolibacter sp.]
MKNKDIWQPSKFIYKNKKLLASRDPKEVSISSRLIVDIVAQFYDKNLKLYAKGNLLDLGCGKVPLYEAYKDYISDNICVDWGQTLHRNPYLDYEFDLNKSLLLNDNEFDTIILSDVLEHIRNPELLWAEMYRVLKKNGKLIMNVPFYYWLHEQPYDYFRYTKFALKSMAEEAGFKIVLLHSIGGVPEILADIIAKNIKGIPLVGNLSAITLQWITKHFASTHIGSKISIKTGEVFPLGYALVAEKNQ